MQDERFCCSCLLTISVQPWLLLQFELHIRALRWQEKMDCLKLLVRQFLRIQISVEYCVMFFVSVISSNKSAHLNNLAAVEVEYSPLVHVLHIASRSLLVELFIRL